VPRPCATQARKWGLGSKPGAATGKLDFTEGEAPRMVPVDAGAALSGPSRMEAEDSDSDDEVVEEVRAACPQAAAENSSTSSSHSMAAAHVLTAAAATPAAGRPAGVASMCTSCSMLQVTTLLAMRAQQGSSLAPRPTSPALTPACVLPFTCA
jgi:hypothetical protein